MQVSHALKGRRAGVLLPFFPLGTERVDDSKNRSGQNRQRQLMIERNHYIHGKSGSGDVGQFLYRHCCSALAVVG